MTTDQALILTILLATVGMFLWGKWRHDMVALGALLACVIAGLIEPDIAFSGFGHPAVITVACVLVLSRGLQSSGAVDALARLALPQQGGPVLSLAALTGLGAALSGFMNNVGAMALLMPVAVQMAKRHELPPGQVLMPLAFGTILGGTFQVLRRNPRPCSISRQWVSQWPPREFCLSCCWGGSWSLNARCRGREILKPAPI